LHIFAKTVYQRLVKVAEQEGMTPRDWIASKVSSLGVSSDDNFQPIDDLIVPLLVTQNLNRNIKKRLENHKKD